MGDVGADKLVLGRISGLFGVKGWLKIYSDTQPRDGIVHYNPWYIHHGGEWQARKVEDGRAHGKGVIAKLEGCDDRDQAASLLGAEIAINREQLEPLAPGEYYWADLIGLRVLTEQGVELGVIDYLFETGANDVLVVKGDRERLIPYVQGDVIKDIDLEQGEMRVDWDPDF